MPATLDVLLRHNINIEMSIWRRTVFETITVLIILVIILVNPISHSKKLLYSRQDFEGDQTMVSHKLDNIETLTNLVESKREQTKYKLAYTPNSVFTKEVITTVAALLELNGTTPFENSEVLQSQFDDRTTLAAIVFDNVGKNQEDVPKELSISIRFPSEFRTISPFLTDDRLWLRRCSGVVDAKRDNVKDTDTDQNQDLYIREGFLQLQHLVFMEWLHKLRVAHPPKFPEPQVEVTNVRLRVADERCSTMDIYTVPSFLYNFVYLLPFINIIWNVTRQLTDGVMTHQWHYGYSFTEQYFCQFIVIFVRLLVVGFFVVILIFIAWSLENKRLRLSAVLGMFGLILIFTVELILSALVIAKMFRNSTNAILFAIIIWLFNYAAFSVIIRRYWDNRGPYMIFILCAFFGNQFPFGMQMFHRFIAEPHTIGEFDFVQLYLTGLVFIIINLIGLYVLQWLMPGPLLSRKMVYGKRTKNRQFEAEVVQFGRPPHFSNFEFGDVGSVEMARLKHIYTINFTTQRNIIKNVSLRAYQGEVYILLGHIGSGKLTLIRILCGLKYPVSGSVLYMGNEIYSNIRANRKLIDFRNAENGQVQSLSLEQTISYHVRLKLDSNDKNLYESECRKWIEILEKYIAKRHVRISKMTAGERKLVAVCCAMVCDTKIVVLDEPTLQLTPRETQIFWNIISLEKAKRAVFIATYSIDEAEAVADRIGILSLGVLEASGTPFFMRTKFSNCVQLVLIKQPHVSDVPITKFIRNYIPEAEPENEIGDTLSYKIDRQHRTKLQKMLIHLENERKKLGIENIRVVGSEMSDIYMKLSSAFRLQQQIIPDVTQTFKYSVISKKQLRRLQMRAMLFKKMIHFAPNLWPIIMVFASCILILIITNLAVKLELPYRRNNAIALGFKGAIECIKNIPNILDCGYIDIRAVAESPVYKGPDSRIFTSKSFACIPNRYKQTLGSKRGVLESLGAVEIEGKQDMHGYISQDTFHSAPMMLNLLHNIILRLTYPEETDIRCLIENHPMPTPLSMKINLLHNELAHINAPLAFGCILPLTISVFILPLAQEHICQIRIIQIIAGLGLNVYWAISLLWDFLTFLVYAIIIVVIFACTNIGNFGAYENLLMLLLMAIYGLAALPITYVISMYVNRSIMKAFLASVLFHSITGLFIYIVYWDVANSNIVFFYGACMFPGFALLDGISNINIRYLEMRICREKCVILDGCTNANMHEVVPNCNFESVFKWADPGILPAMTFMLLASLIALILLFWVELHRREKKFHTPKDLHKFRSATYDFDDADVADVKQRIANADMSKCKQSVFLVDQVEDGIPVKGTKLNTVSFALNKYMSMAIYGPRNSGKSHLMRQLAGIDGFSFGEIYVRGLDFKYDLDTILGYVGYCPQHDGLLGELTPREHIRLICMIRGVPEDKIDEKMRDLYLMLNMTGWIHRKCNTLTPEKCRKVCIALSLVAYNKIFLLDEPTGGMPSTTRREIWNILRYLRYCGKTIIFSTNDEYECKVLADFVLLFQHSEMLAIGSTQYLRYKYSHGFYLEVRIIRDGNTLEESEANLRKDIENLQRFVTFLHEKSELVDRRQNWFKYYIPVGHIVYSFLYGALEKNKARLNIGEYSIYQANLNVIVAQVQETRAALKRNLAHQTYPSEGYIK